jgi:hypothetical protein
VEICPPKHGVAITRLTLVVGDGSGMARHPCSGIRVPARRGAARCSGYLWLWLTNYEVMVKGVLSGARNGGMRGVLQARQTRKTGKKRAVCRGFTRL